MDNVTKQHDDKSISIIGKKRTKLLHYFIISLTFIVLVVVYFVLPKILGEKESASPQIRQMTQLTVEVGKLETLLKKKELEFSNLIKEYNEKTDEEFPTLSASGLTEGQKKFLENKLNNQEDVTIRELLIDILDIVDEISRIKETIKKYEALLPKPHTVIEGESHYQIAMNFLINEKEVEEKKANWLLERTGLFDTVIPGFKVWNFYSGNEYGTFVTQGDAPISPNELTRQAEKEKKELIDEKDRAIAEKDRLNAEIKILETTRNSIIAEVENLRSEKKDLMEQIEDLHSKNKEMQKMQKEMQTIINSLSYVVVLEKDLIRRGILKSVLFGSAKMINMPSEEYFKQYFKLKTEKIDLRKETRIEIYAEQLMLTKIKEITLYPKFYKRDIDYKVKIEENKQKAVLTILSFAVEKFKTGRVIISVN